jgi:hypothetical protein
MACGLLSLTERLETSIYIALSYRSQRLLTPEYEHPDPMPPLILLIMFLGGVQMLSISILSEYIGKILEESKQRPRYVIKKILNKK